MSTATHTPPVAAIFAPRDEGPWLFGRGLDMLLFGGSALLAFVLVALGAATGLLTADVPHWVWIVCILSVDVAHVWSTLFRVYLDGAECSLDNLDGCQSCTYYDDCGNPCEPELCELCFGQDPEDLPPECEEGPTCPEGETSCTDENDCEPGEFCQTGCCAPIIPQ